MSELVARPVLVEYVIERGAEVHVVIVLEDRTNFALTDASTLGGRPIHKWLSQPRALDANGRPRTDVFVVVLKSRSDRAHFSVGDRPSLLVEPLSG
jgi:hypothetical protein